ncbi:hypothetical protein ACFE04_022470 [Oxalis oulophora]
MGLCISSPTPKQRGIISIDTIRPQQITIIHVDENKGKVEELKQPIKAEYLVTQNPNYFICSSESMSIGTCPPRVCDDEELQLGQIYFMLPKSRANEPLSLPDLCGLAIKASSAVAKDAVDFSSGKPTIVFR